MVCRQVDSGVKSWVNLGIRDSFWRAEDRRAAEAMSTGFARSPPGRADALARGQAGTNS